MKCYWNVRVDNVVSWSNQKATYTEPNPISSLILQTHQKHLMGQQKATNWKAKKINEW